MNKLADSEKVRIILQTVFPNERIVVNGEVAGEEGIHVNFLSPKQSIPNPETMMGDYIICPHDDKFLIMYFVETPQTQDEPAGGDYEEFKGVAWTFMDGFTRRQTKPAPETELYDYPKEAVMQLVVLITAGRLNDAFMVIEEKELDLQLDETENK